MKNDIVLVKMIPEHLNFVTEIEKLCFTDPWSEKSFRESLGCQLSVFMTAMCDEIVSGYIGFYDLGDECEILNIAVSPDYRRLGIASIMLKYCCEYASLHGSKRILLEVRRSNLIAIKLYQASGFELSAVRHGYYTKPREDALIYIKNIKENL